MKKKLTREETLRVLIDNQIITSDRWFYKMINGQLYCNEEPEGEFRLATCGLDFVLDRENKIFSEPEKPKSLSEKFKSDFPFKITVKNYGGFVGKRIEQLPTTNVNEIFYLWLKEQEND